MKGKLRSWWVRVRDANYSTRWNPHEQEDSYYRAERDHYVVARSQKSARRQALIMAGWPDPGRKDQRANVLWTYELEVLE